MAANNVFVTIPASMLSSRNVQQPVQFQDLPSLSTMVLHVACCLIIEDFLFYWSHRFLHVKSMYESNPLLQCPSILIPNWVRDTRCVNEGVLARVCAWERA